MTRNEILKESKRILDDARKQMIELARPFANSTFARIPVDGVEVIALICKDDGLYIRYYERGDAEAYTDPIDTLSINGIGVLAAALAEKAERGYLAID